MSDVVLDWGRGKLNKVTKLSGRKGGERQSQRDRETGCQEECTNQHFKSQERKQMPQSQLTKSKVQWKLTSDVRTIEDQWK